jgi:hypothetical protein
MKTYTLLIDDAYTLEGGPQYIPVSHKARIDAEVSAGYAVVLPYTATEVTPREKRDLALLSLAHDFGDGRVIQVRPIDEGNIRNKIELMTRKADELRGWRMVDNTWHDVTVAELQAALESGQDQGDLVWDQFRSDTQ